ncbi:kinase-interacting protein 1-like [Rutidosis leptorrhynchoides]|uniref:kinase-interacting protein 1-like n=1 Tax=Rutidosis leptorrhynchoides TaxID=125765 RepID=UPI003A991044
MLQRAASNAFSWWWASHIRTKQSKWLEQSLLDMEDKVHSALNIIQKDGDSFAKRAEMYYRHRPDLICFVEETFRAYRALSERYDKLSRDLQKANTTIASIFPEQVSYDDFDDDFGPPKMPKNFPLQDQGPNAAKIPKVPQLPNKNLKGLIGNASKKMQISKAFKEETPVRIVPKSGLSEDQAVEEIDKIQKEILAMQTMKEFTKSEYENGLSKYWEIENKINTMQQRVCRLQDEFKVGRVIEDGDARTVMAQAALKSCKETLEKLEEKRENSNQAARTEHEKIVDAKQKIIELKRKYLAVDESEQNSENESQILNQKKENEDMEKIKEKIEELSKKPLTVSGLADSVDKLANNVISLESTLSSQTANIDKLRTQAGELQTQIQNLEGDKGDGAQMSKKLNKIEKTLHELEELEKYVVKENSSLKVCFTEANCKIVHLSEKLHDVQPDEEVEMCSPASEEEYFRSGEEHVVEEKEIHCTGDDGVVAHTKTIKKKDNLDDVENENTKQIGETNENGEKNVGVVKAEEKIYNLNTCVNDEVEKKSDTKMETEDECRKNPLKEYTKTLKNYKETKRKLSDEEKKKLNTLFELIVQVRELKTGILKRDSEIQMLKHKLNQLQVEENWQEVKQDDASLEDEEINISVDEPSPISEIEEKFRTEIDVILDENLDFWMRFSTQFHEVQKFKTEVEDLKKEIHKVKAKAKCAEAKSNEEKTNQMFTTDLKSEIRPIYKHLKEIQGELTLWLEQAMSLKEELQMRCSSLSNIKEEITMALKEGMLEDEIKFSTHQAAKFQGELLNMEQENNRVNEELEAGLNHVRALHHVIKRILRRLEDEFGLSDNQMPYKQSSSEQSPTSRPGIPLRSFIFGVKAKKQKPSIFNVINNHKKTKR